MNVISLNRQYIIKATIFGETRYIQRRPNGMVTSYTRFEDKAFVFQSKAEAQSELEDLQLIHSHNEYELVPYNPPNPKKPAFANAPAVNFRNQKRIEEERRKKNEQIMRSHRLK